VTHEGQVCNRTYIHIIQLYKVPQFRCYRSGTADGIFLGEAMTFTIERPLCGHYFSLRK
jgi:hypothetical protein